MIDEEALLDALTGPPVVEGRSRELWADDAVLRRWAQKHGGRGAAPAIGWLRTAGDVLQAATHGPGPEADPQRMLTGSPRSAPRVCGGVCAGRPNGWWSRYSPGATSPPTGAW